MRERMRVAVTGAGGGVGQSIIKALQNTEYDVVALDSDPLAAGLYAAPRAYVVPRPHEPSFVDHVLAICQAQRCQLLFPGLDTELPTLARARERFLKAGVTPIVSTPRVVETSDDKLLTYQRLAASGIGVPATVDLSSWTTLDHNPLPYPYVLKQRVGGSRSRDVYLVRSDLDVERLALQVDISRFVAQEYLDGDEYTCGSVTLDGVCLGVIVMRRTLRNGDTYKCFALRDDVIEAEVRKLMDTIQPFGACNAQLRLRDGQPFVFEINARCSGTTAARALCGFNEPKMIADYVCHGLRPRFSIKEQAVLRYWNELAVADDVIETITMKGGLERVNWQYL